jgi:DNA invertase Pin-like site-specific DNA recombinase
MLVGYARVSIQDQTLDLQKDALNQAGCNKIFTGTANGARLGRPGLEEALGFVREGDTLAVWRLDRLGGSLKQPIDTVSLLHQRGIGFRSLTESIEKTSNGGKLIFYVFGALAEFERDLIRERTQAGLQAARARGRRGGRPRSPVLSDPKTLAMAQVLYSDKRNTVAEICRTLRLSRANLYRYISVTDD